jgi:glycosyltransferase involved in cell wall biosynthesis
MNADAQERKAEKALRVLLATPFGFGGRGGIDRLTDLMVEGIQERASLGIYPVRLVTRGQASLLHAGFVFAGALAKLWAAARRGDVDVVHINLASSGSTYRKLTLAALARFLRIPYVVHLHSGRFDKFWQAAGPRLAAAIDYFFENASAIIVLGEYWARVVCDRVPAARGKTVVLANATLPSPSDRVPSGDGRVRITFLGKIGPNKGTRQLIEALATLKDRSDWNATICGNGAVEESRNLAKRLGIADRTRFPGWLDDRATADQLRQTDIFVLPSFSEGLPMSILEAFAWGIAVVATPVGSIPEVINHERNGLIVPVGDVPALGLALRRLVADSDLRRMLGNTARRDHAARFDINVYIPRLTAIWRAALAPGVKIGPKDSGCEAVQTTYATDSGTPYR